jgi:hypothetical protein
MERSRMLVAAYFRISQARDEMKAPDIYRDELGATAATRASM